MGENLEMRLELRGIVGDMVMTMGSMTNRDDTSVHVWSVNNITGFRKWSERSLLIACCRSEYHIEG